MYRVDNKSGEDKWNSIGIKIEESKKKTLLQKIGFKLDYIDSKMQTNVKQIDTIKKNYIKNLVKCF